MKDYNSGSQKTAAAADPHHYFARSIYGTWKKQLEWSAFLTTKAKRTKNNQRADSDNALT